MFIEQSPASILEDVYHAPARSPKEGSRCQVDVKKVNRHRKDHQEHNDRRFLLSLDDE